MATPFFSVVIPTKGRSHLVSIALSSLMRQTFEDWEAVVADNNDDDLTEQTVATFTDPRIRHCRSGGLSMPDNWEFACAQAKGEYVCVLEDKQAFKFDALDRIARVIEERRAAAVRWQSDSIRKCGIGYRIRKARGDGTVRSRDSEAVLQCFISQSYSEAKRLLPIAHFSAFHKDVLDQIRSGPVGRLCPPVSPDYTLAIQVLVACEQVTYIDSGLVAFSDQRQSNGMSVRLKGELAKQFTRELGGATVYFDHVPVKALTISGTIYNDYCKLRTQLPALEKFPVQWPHYFAACHESIHTSIALGVDMREEQVEWTKALSEQPEAVQSEVNAILAAQDRSIHSSVKALGKSGPIKACVNVAKSIFRGSILRQPEWRFTQIADYLEWEYQNSDHRCESG